MSTPLAGMLPERYRNVDIKEVFPEFRENAVLRFSTLFPIKVRFLNIYSNYKYKIIPYSMYYTL